MYNIYIEQGQDIIEHADIRPQMTQREIHHKRHKVRLAVLKCCCLQDSAFLLLNVHAI